MDNRKLGDRSFSSGKDIKRWQMEERKGLKRNSEVYTCNNFTKGMQALCTTDTY